MLRQKTIEEGLQPIGEIADEESMQEVEDDV